MVGHFRAWMVLPLLAFTRSVALSCPSEQEPALLVELCDATGLGASTLQATRNEASRIFERAVPLRWESHCELPPPAKPQSARVYLVPFIPKAITDSYYLNHGRRDIMGFALPNIGGNHPGVIYVARQSVEATASRFKRVSLTETHLARAMGRVIAHELAHRFLGPGHTKRGMLKDFLDQRDLIGEHHDALFFDPEQTSVLRRLIEARSSK